MTNDEGDSRWELVTEVSETFTMARERTRNSGSAIGREAPKASAAVRFALCRRSQRDRDACVQPGQPPNFGVSEQFSESYKAYMSERTEKSSILSTKNQAGYA